MKKQNMYTSHLPPNIELIQKSDSLQLLQKIKEQIPDKTSGVQQRKKLLPNAMNNNHLHESRLNSFNYSNSSNLNQENLLNEQKIIYNPYTSRLPKKNELIDKSGPLNLQQIQTSKKIIPEVNPSESQQIKKLLRDVMNDPAPIIEVQQEYFSESSLNPFNGSKSSIFNAEDLRKQVESDKMQIQKSKTIKDEEIFLSSQKQLNQLIDEMIQFQDGIKKPSTQIQEKIKSKFLMLSNIILKIQQIDKAQKNLEQIKNLIIKQKWKIVAENLKKLKKLICPLDVPLLNQSIHLSKKSAELLKDKQVLILLGENKSGKSTLIHFFSGTKLKLVQKQNDRGKVIKHIIATQIKNQALKQVKISSKAQPQTKYLTPIQMIQYKKIYDDQIYLCDMPGFKNIEPQYKIANTFGLQDTIKNCKSMRIIVVISQEDLQNQGILKLAKIVEKIVKNINEKTSETNLKPIQYIFTKLSQNIQISTIINSIKSIQNDMGLKEGIRLILKDMLKKITKTFFVINPLKDDPIEMLLEIQSKTNAQKEPSTLFDANLIDDQLLKLIKQQCLINQIMIRSLIKREKYEIIHEKLNQIKLLQEISKQQKSIYSDCIKNVKETMKKKFNQMKKMFDQLYKKQEQQIKKQDLQKFDLYLNNLETSKELREKHLSDQIVLSNQFIKFIVEKIKKDSQHYQQDYLSGIKDSNSLNQELNNILQLSQFFKEIIPIYNEYTNKINIQIKKSFENLQRNFKSEDWRGLANNYARINILRQLSNHLKDKSSIQEGIAKRQMILIKYIKDLQLNLTRLISKSNTNKNQTLDILKSLQTIDKIQINFQLKMISQIVKQVTQKKSNIINKLVEKFQKIRLQISQFRHRDKQFSYEFLNIKSSLDFMKLIKQSYMSLPKEADQKYNESIQIYTTLMKEVRLHIEQLTNQLEIRTLNSMQLKNIEKGLNILKNGKFIDEYKNDSLKQKLNLIQNNITNYIQKLRKSIQITNVDIEHGQNIKNAMEIVQKIEKFKLLEQYFPQLTKQRQSIIQKFMNQIDNNLNSLKKNFSQEIEKDQKKRFSNKKINIPLAANGINYCNYCTIIMHKQIYKRSLQIKNTTILKIHHYIQSIIKNIEDAFSELNYTKQIKQIQSLVKCINQNLNEIANFQKYQNLLEQNKRINLFRRGIDLNNQLFSRLQIDILSSFTLNQLEMNLQIAKAMKNLDKYLDKPKSYQTLYRTNYNRMITQFREIYQRILSYIQLYKFEEMEMELINIDENSNYNRIYSELKLKLNFSINRLIDLTKSKANVLNIRQNNNQNTINQICINLKVIGNVKKFQESQLRQKKKKLLEPTTNQKIINQTTAISKIVENKIYSQLLHIEAIINAQNFEDAQNRIRFITNSIQIINIPLLTERINKIPSLIESEVDKIILQFKNMDCKLYISKPPKTTLEQLLKVRTHRSKYSQAYLQLKSIVKDEISRVIQSRNTQSVRTQIHQLNQIKIIIKTLPELEGKLYESRISEMIENLRKRQYNNQRQMSRILNGCPMTQIKQIIRQLKDRNAGQQQMEEVYRKIIIKSEKLCNQIKEMLKQEDPKIISVLNNLSNLQEIKLQLGGVVKLKTIHDIGKKYLQEFLKKSIQKLKTIQKWKGEDLNQKTKVLEILIIFAQTKKQFEEDYFQQIQMILKEINEQFSKYLKKMLETLQKELQILNFKKLKQILHKLKLYSNFLHQFEIYLQKQQLINEEYISMFKSLNYSKIKQQLSFRLQNKYNEVKEFQLVKLYEVKRNQYYSKLNQNLLKLKNCSELNQYLQKIICDYYIYECVPHIQKIFQQKNVYAQQAIKNLRRQFNLFNNFYENLCSFTNNIMMRQFRGIQTLKNNLEIKFFKKIQQYKNVCVQKKQTSNKVARCLIEMKFLSNNIPLLKDKINTQIDQSLKIFINNHREEGDINFSLLIGILQKDELGVGTNIIDEHSAMIGYHRHLIFKQFSRDPQYILNDLKGEGDQMDIQILRKNYHTINQKYEKKVKDYLIRIQQLQDKSKAKNILQELVLQAKKIVSVVNSSEKFINWGERQRNIVAQLISLVCSLWTLKNRQFYQLNKIDEKQRQQYLIKPHPAQIIAILRIFTVGSKNFVEKLQNHLIQIKTGEGKSVVLAITSIILALMGCDVNCVCYSKYLSQRDYESFQTLFEAFGVSDSIHYDTFNQICQNQINQNGDSREQLLKIINNNQIKKLDDKNLINKPKVLIIDEVDVFFKKDFYGNIYTPVASLKDQTIINLTKYIWSNRKKSLYLASIKNTPQFQACINRFPNYEFLIEEAVKDMLADLTDYQHVYVVSNDKIAYKEHDGLVYNVVYGYKTMFAYYYQNQNDRISNQSLQQNISIGIKYGSFSYAEILYSFKCILGVSGTLQSLSDYEKIVIQSYNIRKLTFIPTAFSKNIRGEIDIIVENKQDYNRELVRKIEENIKNVNGQRAVLVFFYSAKQLLQIYDSPQIKILKASKNIQLLYEELGASRSQIETIIKRTTSSGQITFLTRVFGRGVDFVCRNQNVIRNGGVHVISTFFSQEYSQQVQIRGRSARQGQKGSFGFVLLDEDLQKFIGINYINALKVLVKQKNLYEGLHQRRIKLFEEKYKSIQSNIQLAKTQHFQANKFLELINRQNQEQIIKYLKIKNQGTPQKIDCRLMILMDATGSMASLLQKVAQTVKLMFQRVNLIIQKYNQEIQKYNSDSKRLQKSSFKLQFVVYRDYDQGIDGILQYSPWQTQPNNLRQFMKKIEAQGGDDYQEAIQIGLLHANQEHIKQPISGIILIADAPAKTLKQIRQYRKRYVGQDKWISQFGQATDYKKQIQKLKQSKIPVHTLYLDKSIEAHFKQIANETGGESFYLDVEDDGAQKLTSYVSVKILKEIGGEKGNDLAVLYRNLYKPRAYA